MSNRKNEIEITCGKNIAILSINRFEQRKPCIFFKNSWITPHKFESISDQGSYKNWIKSIRHNGRTLRSLIIEGKLKLPTRTLCEKMNEKTYAVSHSTSEKEPCNEGNKLDHFQQVFANNLKKPEDEILTENSFRDVTTKFPQATDWMNIINELLVRLENEINRNTELAKTVQTLKLQTKRNEVNHAENLKSEKRNMRVEKPRNKNSRLRASKFAWTKF
jgi:hypothetical protein